MKNPEICCETIDRITSFCFIQCTLPRPNNCVCIDSTSGERLAGLHTYPEPLPSDPNPIDCDIILPLTPTPSNTYCSNNVEASCNCMQWSRSEHSWGLFITVDDDLLKLVLGRAPTYMPSFALKAISERWLA